MPKLELGHGVSEWLDLTPGLSGDSGQRGPYCPYKPCNHSLYIGIIISLHIDNTQATINFKKKKIKERGGGGGHPLSWQIIGEKDSGSVYIMNLQSIKRKH